MLPGKRWTAGRSRKTRFELGRIHRRDPSGVEVPEPLTELERAEERLSAPSPAGRARSRSGARADRARGTRRLGVAREVESLGLLHAAIVPLRSERPAVARGSTDTELARTRHDSSRTVRSPGWVGVRDGTDTRPRSTLGVSVEVRSPVAESRARGLRWPGGRALDSVERDAGLVRASVRRADAGAGARAGRRSRAAGHVLVQAPTGSGKTLAAFLVGIDRLNATPGRGPPAPLRLAAQGAELRHRAQPPRPARRPPLAALGRRPHGRHAAARAAADAAHAAGRPDHDPRVALPAPHLAGPRAARNRRDGDPRRGARGRGHEARRAPRALARAARAGRRSSRSSASASPRRSGRSRRSAASSRARGRRSSSSTRARARSSTSRSSSRSRTCASSTPAASCSQPVVPDGVEMDSGYEANRALDLAVDLPGAARARARAPLDDRLRQQPPAGRAARAADQRARPGRGGARRAARDRARAPRLARARAAARRSRRT